MNAGSLCTGFGGLDLAVEAVTGAGLAWASEIDPGASAVLACRFPAVPNLGDLTAPGFTPPPAVILTGGFPCQPVSAAGHRKGTDDERWLFDDITAAIGRMDPRPRLLVFENVPGLLTANRGAAMARVIPALAALGYVGRYRSVRASDVGAPHRRERIFIVAWPAADAGRDPRPEDNAHGPAAPRRDRGAAADAGGIGWPGRRAGSPAGPDEPRERPRAAAAGCRPAAADADGGGRRAEPREQLGLRPAEREPGDIAWGTYGPAIARWEHVTGRAAPRPTEPGRGRERLSPRFVEWMMGLHDGWVTDVPDLPRNAQLRILGNGVVRQQAEAALRQLLAGAPELTA